MSFIKHFLLLLEIFIIDKVINLNSNLYVFRSVIYYIIIKALLVL
jgi:hypothetical protein